VIIMARTLTPSRNPDRAKYLLALGNARYRDRKPAFVMPIYRPSEETKEVQEEKS
jgi:hypothetical protein